MYCCALPKKGPHTHTHTYTHLMCGKCPPAQSRVRLLYLQWQQDTREALPQSLVELSRQQAVQHAVLEARG